MALITLPRRRPLELPFALVALSLVVAAAMLLPVAYLLLRVIGDADALATMTRARTLSALLRTGLLAAAVTGGVIALAVPLAWLTVATDLPMRRFWSVVLALPLVFPSYVGAFAFVAALGPRGMLQDLLAPLGVESLPEIYGFGGAWIVLVLFTYPYVLLPVRAAVRGLDGSLEEAARGMGAGRLETLLRVTLPQLRPAMAAGGLLVALYVLSDFGAVSIMDFDSLTRIIYVQYTSALDRGSAAALALLLVGLALVLILIEGASRGRARYHTRNQGGGAKTAALGRWRWLAFAFCGAVTFVALVLPTSVLGYWMIRGLSEGESVSFVRNAAINSAYASGVAAIVAVAVAMPIVVLSVRYPGLLSRVLEKATYAGFAIPGIAVALSLVFFGANYATFVYQTLALLVFAYVVRFLPQALGACRASYLQVNPKTEEAGRGLGKGPLPVFARVTIPQMLPGISAGAVLVFLTAMKELPATLLLSPLGFDTLSTEIWSATTEAFFTRAALPALILVAVSAVPMTVMVLQERIRE